ncbi:MAG: DUF4296 domain-containing protein [Saprospiraceae bacterium]|nr:DUF4296 domain-containing protein [Saprospiraceae bacterium]MCF8249260.1 DUF4296 domain-containing protein [Saprospiraceae bacterium]MCF8281172.1 DUF4296 domain-containing protein [Bacteroidales bacterium]MCF8311463.1 DUF4296 domain-containing protein [Saprospiraceae bacterium]
MSQQSESLPISQEKLEKVMTDAHIAESAVSGLPNGLKKDSVANLYYDQIAEIHKIDRETIDTCIAILQRNPELTSETYGKMSEALEKRLLGKSFE